MEALTALRIMVTELDVLEKRSGPGKYVGRTLPNRNHTPEPIILHAFGQGCPKAWEAWGHEAARKFSNDFEFLFFPKYGCFRFYELERAFYVKFRTTVV